MAWTAPMTAVAGAVFTAAEFNQFVRDNMQETAVAKADIKNAIFTGNGLNEIAQRTPRGASKTGSSTTTATSYGDLLDGTGPTITLTTGSSAMVWIYCNQYNTAGNAAWMSFEISGATATSASDSFAVQGQGTDGDRVGAGFLIDTLTGGSNTFTAKYRVSTAGTGTFSQRRITIWPF